MSIIVVAEKPSVARDIAQSLGARKKREGYFEGSGYIVSWAVGHLVKLAEPHEMKESWKRWSFSELPMLPERWPLRVIKELPHNLRFLRNFSRMITTTPFARLMQDARVSHYFVSSTTN